MLHAALIAAPLLMQGVSTIGNVIKSRRAKKAMKKQNEALSKQIAQNAVALRQQLTSTYGPAAANYICCGGATGKQGAVVPTWGQA